MIRRLSANPPAALQTYHLAAEKRAGGDPEQRLRAQYTDPTGKLFAVGPHQ